MLLWNADSLQQALKPIFTWQQQRRYWILSPATSGRVSRAVQGAGPCSTEVLVCQDATLGRPNWSCSA